MLKTRVIPSLLILNGGLVKTVRFKKPRYIGDPINAIKIFNDKEADELTVIDIGVSKQKNRPNFEMLIRINKEAFMPLAYGGGIQNCEDIQKILSIGYEKIIINSQALKNPSLISDAASICGSQSVVVCIDVKKTLFGEYNVYDYLKKKTLSISARDYAIQVEKLGAGEILVNSVDKEGTFSGYATKMLHNITSSVSLPVIALGGAGNINDFSLAIKDGGASAVAAGSLFVFYGPHRAVLITYPDKQKLKQFI